MKHLASILAATALLMPMSAFAFNITSYENDTHVAARLISGSLDARLIELGSDFQTKEFMPIMAKTIKDGVVRYCTFLQKSIGKSADKCARTISVSAPNGNFTF